jgi:hypothetical protein
MVVASRVFGGGHRVALRYEAESKISSGVPINGGGGFDTLSCFTCQWSQSAFVRDEEINGLPERYRGEMASSPPLLD